MTRAPRGGWLVARLAGLTMALLGSAAASTTPLDPEEVAALLADLEAHGGILDSQDLALLERALQESQPRPARRAAGLWTVAVDWRQEQGPRLDTRLRRDDRVLRLGARWRGDAQDGHMVAWAEAGQDAWSLNGGAGSLAHGSGLLSAPLGARSSLGVETSLLPPAPGWRPTLAATMPQRLQGVSAGLDAGWITLDMGSARDLDERAARHLRIGLQSGRTADADPGAAIGLLQLRHGGARASGLDLRWRRGPWRLASEAALWRLETAQELSRAWILVAAWRRRNGQAEFQAGGSRAAGAMPGAARPACLPGWQASGWAWRLRGRPYGALRLGLAGSSGEDRDPRQAAGRLRTRRILLVSVSGPAFERGTWELRWRRQDEAQRRWDPVQPWLPAREDRRRLRDWWVLQTEQPAAGGTVRLALRRLEESGQARNLLGAQWQLAGKRWRYRAQWQTAWGDPLDLVTVSAPVSSLVRLRHWGSWESGISMGCEGRGRWLWQIGAEIRRRSNAAGAELVGEGRILCGVCF